MPTAGQAVKYLVPMVAKNLSLKKSRGCTVIVILEPIHLLVRKL